jgi:subtilase family serine protease
MLTAIPGVHMLQSGGAIAAGGPAWPAGFRPSQIAHAYGFDKITFNHGTVIGNGNGQTIAIIDAFDDPKIASDLATFDSKFGLAAPPSFKKVGQSGGALPTATNRGWGAETSLDVEWAHAMAPGAKILLVEANSANFADLFAAEHYARSQPAVSVISMSWLYYEWSTEHSYDSNYFTTPSGHHGITFVAASGDSGSSYVYYPSTSPNVLSVGGTQLTLDALGNYVSEKGWSGSGGGFSAYESQPAYQRGVVTQGSVHRATPDVAYDGSASSPFAVYDTEGYGGWVAAYGTSAGAPQWAALIAIADQGRALAGKGSLDGATQTLPTLYKLPSSDFHDITTGSNGKYSAGPGYDLVTGRGTPRANLIVSGLVGSSSTTTNQPLTIITPASGNTNLSTTGKTANLSVLGADSDGDALTYTWSLTSQPSGAPTQTFSVNATNATNSTTANFYKVGSYTLQVTIADTAGLNVTSSVSVTVKQTLTNIRVAPGKATVADSASQQFSVVELDQFGGAIATQPTFTWTLAAGGIGSL